MKMLQPTEIIALLCKLILLCFVFVQAAPLNEQENVEAKHSNIANSRSKRSGMSDLLASQEAMFMGWMRMEYGYTFTDQASLTYKWGTHRGRTCLTDEKQRDVIRAAFRHISEITCITFYELDNTDRISVNWITIHNDDQDQCYVTNAGGKSGPSLLTTFNLPAKCLSQGIGTVVHLMLHTFGFYHEHQRRNRDKYIKINDENIGNSEQDQWLIKKKLNTIPIGPYDFSSIMHHGRLQDSRNGRPIFTALAPYKLFEEAAGQRAALSFRDGKNINLSPLCDFKCFPRNETHRYSRTKCYHGGYPDPKDCNRCICPPGWSTQSQCKSVDQSNSCSQTSNLTPSGSQTVKSNGQQACNWHIIAPEGYNVELTINDINIKKDIYHESWLEVMGVTDGWMDAGPRFFGTERPQSKIVSDTHEMMIVLKSDQSGANFEANVKAVKCNDPSCNKKSDGHYVHTWTQHVYCRMRHKRCYTSYIESRDVIKPQWAELKKQWADEAKQLGRQRKRRFAGQRTTPRFSYRHVRTTTQPWAQGFEDLNPELNKKFRAYNDPPKHLKHT